MLSNVLEAVLTKVAGYIAGALTLIAAALLAWTLAFEQSPDSPPVRTMSGADSIRVADPLRPIFQPESPTTTSEDGTRTQHENSAPPEGRENKGAVTVSDSSGEESTKIALQPPENLWFPEWGKPTVPIRRLNETSDTVIWTPPSKGFFEWDPTVTVGTGLVFGGRGIGLTAGIVPLRVWNVHVGVHLHVPVQAPERFKPVVSVSTQVRKRLSVAVGVAHTGEPSVSIRYRF